MKKLLLVFIVGLLSTGFLIAQKDYKVVFDLTSKDTLDQRALLRWVGEIYNAPDAQIEVVMYGQGVHLMCAGESKYQSTIASLIAHKNVTFKVCAIAVKAQGINESQLIPGVQVVPDGIYEIIQKQHEGWGYIKAVH